jgi:hypothetical protein
MASVVPLVEQDPSRCQVSSEEGRNVRASLKTFYQDKISDSFGALVLSTVKTLEIAVG